MHLHAVPFPDQISYVQQEQYLTLCCIHCTVDSACNAAGLGFAWYNKLGHAEWNLVSGVDILPLRLAGKFGEG